MAFSNLRGSARRGLQRILLERERIMSKTFKKIWNIFTGILVALVIMLAVALAGVRVIGLQPYAVLSGSMEPTFHTGSLIYVKRVDYTELQVGDPITFMLNENTVATHRIIEILPDEEDPSVLRFRTKGDANNDPDAKSVHCLNVIGKPLFSLPYLGYVADYIQNPPGTYVAISGGAILLLLVFIPDLFSSDDGKKSEKKKSEEEEQAQ